MEKNFQCSKSFWLKVEKCSKKKNENFCFALKNGPFWAKKFSKKIKILF
jgi:hypothetical protein